MTEMEQGRTVRLTVGMTEATGAVPAVRLAGPGLPAPAAERRPGLRAARPDGPRTGT